jgi:hypothetical protein
MSTCTRCGVEIHPEVTSTICVACIQYMRVVTLNNTYGKFGRLERCQHVWKVEDQEIRCRMPFCGTRMDIHDAAKLLNELQQTLREMS